METTTPASETQTSESVIDAVGEETLEIFAENDSYNRLLWNRLNELSPATGRVLEVGCGIGNITRLILETQGVEHVHGIDMDPAYVARLLDELPEDRCSATACSVEEFQTPDFHEAADQSFDAIVCSNVLEHIEDDFAAMRNFRRMLRPGGHALILVPAHPWLFCGLDSNLSHFRRYTKDRFRHLARECGVELVSMRHFNPVGIAGWWLNGKVLGREVLPAGQMRTYAKFAIPISALIDRLNPFPLGISLIGCFRRPLDS
ncbi:MAG: class I SAM-dependent methyltransferase [Planctomycetota bacterium]